MELISREEAMRCIKESSPLKNSAVVTIALNKVRDLLIYESRANGKWIGIEYDGYADGNPVYHRWQCQRCGNEISTEEPPDYCCDCGADMRGEE